MKYPTYLFVFLLLCCTACGEEKTETPTEVIRPVRYAKVLKTNSSASNTFSGVSQSSKVANLSFKVAGTLNSLKVKVGDRVRRGQIIASLDAIDYSVEYDQALANLKNAETGIKSAETQLVATQSTYNRVEKLYENNSVPLSEYEQAKTSYEAAQSQSEAAQAQVTAARKQVEAAKNQVSYARLTAPYAGVITAVNAEENELVGSGSVVAVLSAEGKPEVRVGLPEAFISKVRRGQKVSINFSILPNQSFQGTITEVAFSASDASTYPVIMSIDQPTDDIRPGMATNVTFAMGQQNSKAAPMIIAPAKSIGEGIDGRFVFTLSQNDQHYQVNKTKVEIGALLPEGFEIKSGLKEGDLVATAGLNSLLPGMKVRLLEE